MVLLEAAGARSSMLYRREAESARKRVLMFLFFWMVSSELFLDFCETTGTH